MLLNRTKLITVLDILYKRIVENISVLLIIRVVKFRKFINSSKLVIRSLCMLIQFKAVDQQLDILAMFSISLRLLTRN